jgi:hypothetical protein
VDILEPELLESGLFTTGLELPLPDVPLLATTVPDGVSNPVEEVPLVDEVVPEELEEPDDGEEETIPPSGTWVPPCPIYPLSDPATCVVEPLAVDPELLCTSDVPLVPAVEVLGLLEVEDPDAEDELTELSEVPEELTELELPTVLEVLPLLVTGMEPTSPPWFVFWPI